MSDKARLIHTQHPGEVKEVDAVANHDELLRLMAAGWRQERKKPAVVPPLKPKTDAAPDKGDR